MSYQRIRPRGSTKSPLQGHRAKIAVAVQDLVDVKQRIRQEAILNDLQEPVHESLYLYAGRVAQRVDIDGKVLNENGRTTIRRVDPGCL